MTTHTGVLALLQPLLGLNAYIKTEHMQQQSLSVAFDIIIEVLSVTFVVAIMMASISIIFMLHH